MFKFARRFVQPIYSRIYRPYSTFFKHNYNVVVVDCEATGRSPNTDRIIEIAAIKLVNGITIGSFSSLANPVTLIPDEVQQLTGISNYMVSRNEKL